MPNQQEERLEGQELLEMMEALLDHREDVEVLAELSELHYVDIAYLLTQLEDNARNRLFTLLSRSQIAGVFSEIDTDLFEDLFALLKHEQMSAILELMGQDDIVDILGEVSETLKVRILSLLDKESQDELAELLVYDEYTAGGIMTKDYVEIHVGMTIQQAIEHLRETAPDAETIYYVYVVNDEEQLVGIVSLREIIIANPTLSIESIMMRNVISVNVNQDQEEVARIVSKIGRAHV